MSSSPKKSCLVCEYSSAAKCMPTAPATVLYTRFHGERQQAVHAVGHRLLCLLSSCCVLMWWWGTSWLNGTTCIWKALGTVMLSRIHLLCWPDLTKIQQFMSIHIRWPKIKPSTFGLFFILTLGIFFASLVLTNSPISTRLQVKVIREQTTQES